MRLMLEVMPPPKRANAESTIATVAKIKDAASKLGSVEFLNVPEVTEENYAGVPLYKQKDVSEFASILHNSTHIDVVVNKVAAYLPSENDFVSWLEKSVKVYDIHNFVFVGGNSHSRKYPGPTVVRADEIASRMKKVNVGNICIPSRQHELERLMSKTRGGASFFTTQIIFESASVKHLLDKYYAQCRNNRLEPVPFFISLAPVATSYDLDFFEWLGAIIPAAADSKLRKSVDIVSASVRMELDIFSDILDFIRGRHMDIEISPNVEAVSNANLDAACGLAEAITRKYG